MKIIEYNLWVFVAGWVGGWLWARWKASQPEALISSVVSLHTKVLDRIRAFVQFVELTEMQEIQIESGRILDDWDELFRYYKWASQHRFDGQQKEPCLDIPRNVWKSIDPISLTALAIVCKKFLNRPDWHATYVLLKAKTFADYRSLLKLNTSPKHDSEANE